MSALLDSLASGFRGDARRRAALDAVLRDGLPGPRSEAWKYTSLRALERRTFALPAEAAEGVAEIDPRLLADIPAPRVVFVNGRYDAARSDPGALPDGVELRIAAAADAPGAGATDAGAGGSEAVFARLNTALADTGLQLRLAAGTTMAAPLHLVCIGATAAEDLAWHLAHRVELGAGASLSLVEHQLAAGPHRHLENARLAITLGEGAQLQHVRIQSAAAGATGFLRSDAVLATTASYRRMDLELDGALSRHELNVRLDGDGAQLVANGVLLATGRRHLDTRLGIEHAGRDTSCALQWRGIGAGRGRAVFHGGITIHAGADGADAVLSNKNLLLDEGAEIDTQPVLVIHADEVKAAHGATVGQLDPTALFYLRSRGLAADEARQLLTAAFVREPLAAIASPELRALAQARLDAALGTLAGQ